MFEKLEMFRTSMAMARHAGARQAVVARNIANADTPGYRAETIAPFRDHVHMDGAVTPRATRAGHLAGGTTASAPRTTFSDAEPSPNGNSVALEQEMLASVEVQREHSRALAIYKHSLDLMRASIGRR